MIYKENLFQDKENQHRTKMIFSFKFHFIIYILFVIEMGSRLPAA